jgi:hypothetical protein
MDQDLIIARIPIKEIKKKECFASRSNISSMKGNGK